MKLRRYSLGHTTDNRSKKYLEFFVTEAETDKEVSIMPKAAIFPISQRYDEQMQRHRAEQLIDYLNKIAEATEKAYEQNMIIDILKK